MFDDFSHEKLMALLKFYVRDFATVDGLWFLAVEDKFGLEPAVKLDEKVWGGLGSRDAKRLKEILNLREEDLETFIEIFKLTPSNYLYKPEIRKTSDSSVIIKFPECTSQIARVKAGKGEFPCKTVAFAYYKTFAQNINPKIKIKCLTAPPDPHPKEYWCEWEFTLK
jgi:hypothetical protein